MIEATEHNAEYGYLKVMRDILHNGESHDDRTGVGTLSTFGQTVRHNYALGFPLLTTKKLHVKSIIHELLWFVRGDTNVKYLQDNGVKIWDAWADENGDLGPVYGASFRDFGGDDQLVRVIEGIKSNPSSRRHVMTLWNPPKLDEMRLPPCHGVAIQFNCKDGKIDLATYQRSCDWFLGVPFNIASYSLLLYMVAKLTGHKPRSLFYAFGDAHIYKNHIDQCKEQLKRSIRKPPALLIEGNQEHIEDFQYEDFIFTGYMPHPSIKAKVAV